MPDYWDIIQGIKSILGYLPQSGGMPQVAQQVYPHEGIRKTEPSTDSLFWLPPEYDNSQDYLANQLHNFYANEPNAINSWVNNPALEQYLRYRNNIKI